MSKSTFSKRFFCLFSVVYFSIFIIIISQIFIDMTYAGEDKKPVDLMSYAAKKNKTRSKSSKIINKSEVESSESPESADGVEYCAGIIPSAPIPIRDIDCGRDEFCEIGTQFVTWDGTSFVQQHLSILLMLDGVKLNFHRYLPASILEGLEDPDRRGRAGIFLLQLLEEAKSRQENANIATARAMAVQGFLRDFIQIANKSKAQGDIFRVVNNLANMIAIDIRNWPYEDKNVLRSLSIDERDWSTSQMLNIDIEKIEGQINKAFLNSGVEGVAQLLPKHLPLLRWSNPEYGKMPYTPTRHVGLLASKSMVRVVQMLNFVFYLELAFSEKSPAHLKNYLQEYFGAVFDLLPKLKESRQPFVRVVGSDEDRERAVEFLTELERYFNQRLSDIGSGQL